CVCCCAVCTRCISWLFDHACASEPSKNARQINPVTQMTVRVNNELRLARKRPTVSLKPTAAVTFGLLFSGRAGSCGFCVFFCTRATFPWWIYIHIIPQLQSHNAVAA